MTVKDIDVLANMLVSGEIESTCPILQEKVNDVRDGRASIEELKRELANAKLNKIS